MGKGNWSKIDNLSLVVIPKSIRKALNTWLLIINNITGVSISIKIKSKLNNHCSILNFYITVFIFSNID